jgi:hypothetical protein
MEFGKEVKHRCPDSRVMIVACTKENNNALVTPDVIFGT